MKCSCGILVVAMVVASLACGTLLAEERARDAQVRGTFVRLAEQRVGEREHLAVVVKPLEGEKMVTLLVPRGSELAAVAKRLRTGQKLEITFVVEGGRKWAKRIGGEGLAEGRRDRPRPEGGQDKPRPEGGRTKDAQVRGTFVRLAEQRVGEREHLAVVVKPLEGKEMVTLLVPRGSELAAVAKRLRTGQKLEITFVVEGGRKWAKRIGGEGLAEGRRDRPRPEGGRDKPAERSGEGRERAEAGELRTLVRQLQKRLERMEAELKELRAETAHLRKALGAKPAVKKGSGDKPAAKKKPSPKAK